MDFVLTEVLKDIKLTGELNEGILIQLLSIFDESLIHSSLIFIQSNLITRVINKLSSKYFYIIELPSEVGVSSEVSVICKLSGSVDQGLSTCNCKEFTDQVLNHNPNSEVKYIPMCDHILSCLISENLFKFKTEELELMEWLELYYKNFIN